MNGRSSKSLKWHMGYATRGVAAVVAKKGWKGVQEDLAFLRDVARQVRENAAKSKVIGV